MTINELEQGIRNLIATSPAVTMGDLGKIVSGVLSVIDSFKSLNYTIQSYPANDILKFNMMNDSGKLESNFANSACQVFQERGINLLLYMPRSNPQQYQVPQKPTNNMMGQMAYAPINPQANVYTRQVEQQPIMMASNSYNQAYPTTQMVSNPVNPIQRKQQVGGNYYQQNNGPVKITPKNDVVMPMSASQQHHPKPPIPEQVSASSVENTIPVASSQNSEEPSVSVAQQLASGFDVDVAKNIGGGKSAGRDYLIELLNKTN